MKKIVFVLGLVLSFNAYAANTCGDDLDNNCWDCGKTASDNCTARLNGTSLSITGDGYMKDYYVGQHYDWQDPSAVERPWGNDITSVEISEGIKSIGESTFRKTKITSLFIPASVEEVRMGAVINTSELTEVTFAENSNCQRIYSAAFNNAPNLTNIDIPESVKIIGEGVFNFSGVSSIVLPDAVWTVDGINEGNRAPFVNGLSLKAISVTNVYCSEASRKKCEEYFNQAEFYENETYTYYPIKEKVTLHINNEDGSVDTYQWGADGSAAIYRIGKLKSYKGKRIYTIDEANEVAGDKNRVSITYR